MSDSSRDPPCASLSGDIPRIVLAYAVFASLWILLSDIVVEWLFEIPSAITLASTIKGWLFVLVTALLLYGLLRRLTKVGVARPRSATRWAGPTTTTTQRDGSSQRDAAAATCAAVTALTFST